jgi:ABC-type transport system substrate-binding protein
MLAIPNVSACKGTTMDIPRSTPALPGVTSRSSFSEAVHASVPRHSRRDLLRAAAVLAAAGGMSQVAPTEIRAEASGFQTLLQSDFETGVEIVIPFNPFGQGVSLDPHRAINWGPFWVLMPHVWAGLHAFDENGGVVADLAESVDPNDSADVWTARLKPDLLFANGNVITAQHFVDSWLRALDPTVPAPMSMFMDRVQGYARYIAGESRDIGFSIVDDLTIEIALSESWSSFPAALATFGWAVVDLSVLADVSANDLPLADAGSGVWRITGFVDGDRIVMEPNPNSTVAASPSISRLVWRVMEGPGSDQAALDAYAANELVSADVPANILAQVNGDAALAEELITIDSQASTMAIGLDFNQAPFNDLRYRQAIAASIDREAWARDIQGDAFVPATGVVPPVVTITSNYESPTPIAFNPDTARGLLADAGFDAEQNAPDVVYYQDASATPEEIERHAALLTMIEENSGLVIRHDVTLTADQITALQGDNGGRQFDIVWWWTVTDTPDLLRTIGQSTSPFMAGWFNWSPDLEPLDDQSPGDASAGFDELIATANALTDVAERNDAYRGAEQLMIDNAVYIPLGHWVQRYVQKPWLIGTRQGAWSGRIPVRFDEQVVVRGRNQDE